MRTLLVLIALLFATLASKAQNNSLNYVITASDTVYVKSLYEGSFKIRCTLANGEKQRFSYDEILAYSTQGRRMDKLPIYSGTCKTNNYTLMELVGCNNGIRIYKQECYDALTESLDAVFYYYKNNQCVNTQTNPGLDEIKSFVIGFKQKDELFITME
ncbi:MAG: hypothetical protein AB7S69_15000 [Salinivirgaceae bacterium]